MKKGKRLICGFLAVVALTGIGFNRYSVLSVKGVNANQRPTKEIVKDVYIYTDKYVPLLDTDANEIAGYYETLNGGYAIVENDGVIIEFDDDTSINTINENKELYYFGPTQIYEKKDDILVSVHDSSYEVAYSDICNTSFNFIAEAQKLQDEVLTAANEESEYEETGEPQRTIAPSVWIDLQGGHGNTLRKNTDILHTNRSGRGNCGSTAASIMLLYYDRYVSTKYVDNKYRNEAKWQDLTNKLITYIEPNGGGSTIDDLQDGINKYLKSRKIRPVCFIAEKNDWYKDPKEVLKDKIDANRPIILGLSNHPFYKEHWVVAEGYFQQDGGNKYTYACINDGYGRNRNKNGKRFYVNMSFVECVAYLN